MIAGDMVEKQNLSSLLPGSLLFPAFRAGVSGGEGRASLPGRARAAACSNGRILVQRRLNRRNYPNTRHRLLNTAELPCHFVVGIFLE